MNNDSPITRALTRRPDPPPRSGNKKTRVIEGGYVTFPLNSPSPTSSVFVSSDRFRKLAKRVLPKQP